MYSFRVGLETLKVESAPLVVKSMEQSFEENVMEWVP